MTQIPINNEEVLKLNLNQDHIHLCTFGFATMETAHSLYFLFI